MILATKARKLRITIKDRPLEQVKRYNYLGIIIEETGKIDKEMNQKIVEDGRLSSSLWDMFLERQELPNEIKTQVYHKVVRPIVVYWIKSGMLTRNNTRETVATEMRFLRWIKRITKRDSNIWIKYKSNRIGHWWKQLSWLGHVHRMKEERLSKIIIGVHDCGGIKCKKSLKNEESNGIRQDD